MLRFIGMVCLLSALVLLSGCLPRQDYTYYPPEGKPSLKCVSQCKVASNSCMQFCALKNSTCRSEMQSKAASRYTAYKMQRHAQGLPVKKSYENFERTTSCAHSCNCIPAYNTCYSACGGRVY